MRNRQVINGVANNLKVDLYGEDGLTPAYIDSLGNLAITGSVLATSVTALNVSGIIIDEGDILNVVTVSVQNIPTVSVIQTPLINGTVNFVGTPTFIIGGHGFTQISTTFIIDAAIKSAGAITTSIIDVLAFNRFSYFVVNEVTGVATINVTQQVGLTSSGAFESAGASVEIDSSTNGLIVGKYMRFSRLSISNLSSASVGTTIVIVFQAQY